MLKRDSATPASTSNAEAVVFLNDRAMVTITISGVVSTFNGVQGVNVFTVPITGAIEAGGNYGDGC